MTYPQEFRYSNEHAWVQAGESLATVGITDHAQQELGDIMYVELRKVGDRVKVGEPLRTVESTKAASEIFSPVSGEVTAVNPVPAGNPQMLNADPHGEAWLVQLRLLDRNEIEKLMSAEEYEAFLQKEEAP